MTSVPYIFGDGLLSLWPPNQLAFQLDANFAALAAGGGVASVSNVDGTLTISPTSGSVVASLALGHANTWSGQQTFVAPILGAATGTSLALSGAATITSSAAGGGFNFNDSAVPTLIQPWSNIGSTPNRFASNASGGNAVIAVQNNVFADNTGFRTESCAIFAWSQSGADGSVHLHDIVGVDMRGFLYNPVAIVGSAWGAVSIAQTGDSTGSGLADGFLASIELDVNNYTGSDQATVDTSTSKYGALIPAGTFGYPATAVIRATGTTVATISSGTYNNGTGVITLTMTASPKIGTSAPVIVFSLTGTGAFASLNGQWTLLSQAGATITLQATSGLGAATITGGNTQSGLWHHGFVMDNNAFVGVAGDSFVRLGDNFGGNLFHISPTGAQTFGGTTNPGLRVNNLTTTQKTALTAPAGGMIVYDTTIPAFSFYQAGSWQSLSTLAFLGAAPAGTLTGTTLASGVVTSSLTSVGIIGTGVWNAGAITSSGPVNPGSFTVATLPSPVAGMIARVTDGTAGLVSGNTVTGRHSTPYLVWYNGTNWTVVGT